MRATFVALVALRGVTVIIQTDPLAGVLLVAGAAAGWLWPRWGMLTLAVAAWGVSATLAPSNSITLIGWVAAAMGLFDGRRLRTVLTVQAVVVYAFAAAHKLWPAFLSGGTLAHHAPWLPWPEHFAVAVVFVEAILAVAVARRWPVALPLAAVAHVAFTLGVADDLVHVVALAAFNGLMVLLVAAATLSGEPDFDTTSMARPYRAHLVTPPRPP